jgi:ribonuclease R
VTELGSDYFQYDEIKNELRGERTGIRYRLSDRVRVQVSRVDLDARKIDFRLVRDTPLKTSATTRPAIAERSAGGTESAPRVRPLASEESSVRRKKAVSGKSAAVNEARPARAQVAPKKRGTASKPAAKARTRKKAS